MTTSSTRSSAPTDRWARRATKWLDAKMTDDRVGLDIGLIFQLEVEPNVLQWAYGGTFEAVGFYQRELDLELCDWGLKALYALDHFSNCVGCGDDDGVANLPDLHCVVVPVRELLGTISALVDAAPNGVGSVAGSTRRFSYKVGPKVAFSRPADRNLIGRNSSMNGDLS